MAKRSPSKVEEHRLSNVGVRFEYHNGRANVVVIPDEADLSAASVHDVLRFWTQVSFWAGRFVAANPGWTVNGSDPVERLSDE